MKHKQSLKTKKMHVFNSFPEYLPLLTFPGQVSFRNTPSETTAVNAALEEEEEGNHKLCTAL